MSSNACNGRLEMRRKGARFFAYRCAGRALAGLALAAVVGGPACARGGLHALMPLGGVALAPAVDRERDSAARFQLVPTADAEVATPAGRPRLHAPEGPAATTHLAPAVVRQFVGPPAGLVQGVPLGGMVLPEKLVDPVLSYRPARKGPVMEVGVIGGGMAQRADLAHVGMHWDF